MSWAKQGNLDFWILTGKAPPNSASVFVPTQNIGIDKPHKFKLVDLFQINLSKEDDLQNKLQAIDVIAGEDEASQGAKLVLELIQIPTLGSANDKGRTETTFTINKPFTLTVQNIVQKCKDKNNKLKAMWRGHLLVPSITYVPEEKVFKLILPPNTRIFAGSKAFWSLFGLANAVYDVRFPNEKASPPRGTSRKHDPLDDTMLFDVESEDSEDSEQQEDEEDGDYVPSSTISPQQQRDKSQRNKQKRTNRSAADDIPTKRSKRTIEQEQWGLRNKTAKAIAIKGAPRELDKLAYTYLLENLQNQSKTVPKATFKIESISNDTDTLTQEGSVSSGLLETLVDNPFDKDQVLNAMNNLLRYALTKLNLKGSMLTISKDAESKKLVFKSEIKNSTFKPCTLKLRLGDVLHKLTGFNEELDFTVLPFQQNDKKYPEFESHFISEPIVAKVFKDNANLVSLPAATSVVLTSSNMTNSLYSNSNSKALLCYVTSDKRLISSDSFVFKGQSNLMTCTFYNEQAQAPLVWKEETHFKFVFKNIEN
jgi:hypothetical protein